MTHGLQVPVCGKEERISASGSAVLARQTPLCELLVEESESERGHLKKRLLKEGLLRNECYECGALPIWNGKPLTIQLEHINGTNNDNRIENLSMLCPNCHSQTDTYAGRNARLHPINKCACGVTIQTKSVACMDCDKPLKAIRNLDKRQVIEWPEVDVLRAMIEASNYSAVGRQL